MITAVLDASAHAVLLPDARRQFDEWVVEQGLALEHVRTMSANDDGTYTFEVLHLDEHGQAHTDASGDDFAAYRVTVEPDRPCPVDVGSHLAWIDSRGGISR